MHLKLPQLKAVCPPPFLHASLRLDQSMERPLWIGWFVLKLCSQPLGPLPAQGHFPQRLLPLTALLDYS